MKTFHLERLVDETGISGTGVVAEGVEFQDGTVVLRWISEHTSTGVYSSIQDIIKIHGHNGSTIVVPRYGD